MKLTPLLLLVTCAGALAAAEYRPLGGINRLRLAVYEASAQLRHMPLEPSRL